MGRHGKNLRPTARPAIAESAREKMTLSYEKYMMAETAKQDIARRTTDTCMAAAAGILLYHMDDLSDCPPDERLKIFHGLFKRYIAEKLERPDERQQFAEWYWTACTGDDLIRAKDLKEFKMAKKYSTELSLALKNKINDQGYDMQDICQACGVSKGVYYNLTGGGAYSKKAFDAVAKFVGLALDEDLKQMYNARFDIGNTARLERMEEMALEVEKQCPAEEEAPKAAAVPVPEESRKEKLSAGEPGIDTGGPIDKDPEEAGEAVEAVLDNAADAEQVPFADCNEMYREAKPSSGETMSMTCLMDNIEAYSNSLQELQDEYERLLKEAEKVGKFIRLIKAYKEL